MLMYHISFFRKLADFNYESGASISVSSIKFRQVENKYTYVWKSSEYSKVSSRGPLVCDAVMTSSLDTRI